MRKVLFICLGNICRSPIAEATFRVITEERGLSHAFEVDSAGIQGWHTGQRPDKRTIKNAEKHNIELTHLGRKVKVSDLDDFDHLVVMDEENFEAMHTFYYETKGVPPAPDKLFLIRDHDPEVRGAQSVPDPYYESESAFEEVYQIVHRSNTALISYLVDKYGL
ncbi:MAG: low molecular weight protein-tyrosine-phosphatase [Leadbetterella sp.]